MKSIIKSAMFASLTDLNVWLTEEREEEIEIIAFYPAEIHNVNKMITIYFRYKIKAS